MHMYYELNINQLPVECVKECSAPGSVGQTMKFWRNKLNFTVDRQKAIAYLTGYWDDPEDWTDTRLAETILWIACVDFSEWDGTRESSFGSDIFVMES